MTTSQAQVSVRILDKEYKVACPAHERTDLLDSAEVLNAKMLEIRDSGRSRGPRPDCGDGGPEHGKRSYCTLRLATACLRVT